MPMMIPEINADHADIIVAQRKRLGTQRGFIAVKPNCSIQTYVPALHPLSDFGIREIVVCTYQAISGAGKTFESWPEMLDNIIPYIGGEEQKSEQEPLKIWGRIDGSQIANAASPVITSQCIRVPVSDGHLAATFVRFDKKPSIETIKRDGRILKACLSSLGCQARPTHSSYTLRTSQGRRQDWIGIMAMECPYPSAVFAKTRSMITNSFALATTRFGAQPAVLSLLQSF